MAAGLLAHRSGAQASLLGPVASSRRPSAEGTAGAGLNPDLDQYFTPTWVAEALVEQFFPTLATDFVVDAGCGHGAFLGALPASVDALGVEIDPEAAAIARRNTGRLVLTGDFLDVELTRQPTMIIGNPPFREAILDAMLARAHLLLPRGGQVGWVLPAYVFQTPSRVLAMAERWSIESKAMLPRTLYRGLKEPLAFMVFTKDGRRLLQGFALYREAAEVAALSEAYRVVLSRAPRSAWVRCVADAVRTMGGTATLPQIYAEIGGRRPSQTTWWREKVRQVAQAHLVRLDSGTYGLAAR